jgi:hypothetical protein
MVGGRHALGCEQLSRRGLFDSAHPPNRVGAGLTPAPPTPPGVRDRTGRFARLPGDGGMGQ